MRHVCWLAGWRGMRAGGELSLEMGRDVMNGI